MDKAQQKYIQEIVEFEGFEYAFCHYSDFKEIQDEEFHTARKAYEEAAKKLKKIIGLKEYD